MKTSFLAGIAAAALTVFAASASATTINFNVDRGWTNHSNSYLSTDGSVSVDVDGVRVDSNGTIINTNNYYTNSRAGSNGGIGVYTCRMRLFGGCEMDNGLIEGFGPDEFALLDFGDLTVEVTSVTFTHWDRNDTFAFGIYADTTLPASAEIYERNLDDGGLGHYTHMFSSGEVVGSIIGFGADSWTDNFRLNSISFDVVSAVPLPAGLALMLTGLGGLGLMRRRRKAAAA